MGVQVKKEKKFLSFQSAFFLQGLMRQFTINTLADMDALKERLKPIESAITEFQEKCGGDPVKGGQIANELSKVEKPQIAYLEKKDLDAVIMGKGFNMDAVSMLEFWLVKD